MSSRELMGPQIPTHWPFSNTWRVGLYPGTAGPGWVPPSPAAQGSLLRSIWRGGLPSGDLRAQKNSRPNQALTRTELGLWPHLALWRPSSPEGHCASKTHTAPCCAGAKAQREVSKNKNVQPTTSSFRSLRGTSQGVNYCPSKGQRPAVLAGE